MITESFWMFKVRFYANIFFKPFHFHCGKICWEARTYITFSCCSGNYYNNGRNNARSDDVSESCHCSVLLVRACSLCILHGIVTVQMFFWTLLAKLWHKLNLMETTSLLIFQHTCQSSYHRHVSWNVVLCVLIIIFLFIPIYNSRVVILPYIF